MFTIGADPEFFIHRAASGMMQPIVGLLGGTKEKPIPVAGARAGFAVQEDNVMAEYNIPPTTDFTTFAEYVSQGRRYALNMIRRAVPDAEAYSRCSATFTDAQLSTPQAQMFGCSPDFDAYAQGAPLPRIQPQALSVEGGAMRFAGGHVHLGYRESISWPVPDFVVATLCDLMVSLPLIAYGYDPQQDRRRFYGTPGRYRPTRYGIEYRTLGNYWTLSPKVSQYVGMASMHVMQVLDRGEAEVRRIYNDMPWQDIRTAVAEEDSGTCTSLRSFARTYGLEVI